MSLPPNVVTEIPGPKSRALAARVAAVECPAFDARREARAAASGSEQSPIVYARGEGANVFDVDGNRYVDLVAGFGALIFGHSPANVKAAVRAQEDELVLGLGDVYASDVKVRLCEELVSLFPEKNARVMLGLSGADALTAALKTIALTERTRVVAFEGGYHGLSHGPLAACGLSAGFRAPFGDQVGAWTSFFPYPSDAKTAESTLGRLKRLAPEEKRAIGGLVFEPVLGRGGIVPLANGVLRDLRALCDAEGWLLVADEIFCGSGRAGALAITLEEGVVPDVLCLGKGLGAGWPVSAMIGRGNVMDAWGAHHGTAIHTATHFGSPAGCAAALTVLEALTDERHAITKDVGARFAKVLEAKT
ncbi:MAG TPA: aminotransferase class III-fold pyridoxal phosphate-dependent enzyme, partial [Polyangiaceae bacterium]